MHKETSKFKQSIDTHTLSVRIQTL